MKLGLTEGQYKKLLTLLQEQAEAPAAEPEKGTSDKQTGGQGYPAVGKWESGITRGPANQVGVTKWADVVGAKLNRGKANPLKEQTTQQQVQKPKFEIGAWSSKLTNDITKDQYGNDYDRYGSPMTGNHYGNDGKYYHMDHNWNAVDIQDYTPQFWKGREKPIEPYLIPKDGPSINGYHYDAFQGRDVLNYVPDRTRYKRPGDKDYVLRNPEVNNKFYRIDLNNWYLGNMGVTLQHMENFQNRKTDSGIDVPKGFNPNTYNEYLSKRDAIQQQIDSIDEKHNSHWNPFKSNFGPGGYWDRKELNYYNNLKQQLVDLKNQYWNPNHSYGLNPKESEQYERMKKELDDMFSPLMYRLQQEIKRKEDEYVKKYGRRLQPIAQDATRNVANEKFKKSYSDNDCNQYASETPERALCILRNEYTERRTKLDLSFGKDDWGKNIGMFGQGFDEWWDKWGGYVQFGGNILLIALSGSIVAVIRGGLVVAGEAIAVDLVANSGMMRAVAPYVLDSIFNGTVAGYQISRKQDEEAMMSIICALVPFISFGANLGKVSVETSQKLALKIAKSDLDNPQKLIAFAENLTDEERFVFRDVYNLPRQAIKKGLDTIIKDKKLILSKIGYKIAKPAKNLWLKSLGKTAAIEMGLPLSASIGNSLFDVIKNKNITNFTLEELAFIQQSIKRSLEPLPPEKALVAANGVIENLENFKSVQDISDNILQWSGREPTPEEMEKINKLREKFKWKKIEPKK